MLDVSSSHYIETIVSSVPVSVNLGPYKELSDIKIYDIFEGEAVELSSPANFSVDGQTALITSKNFGGTSTIATLISVPLSQIASYTANDNFPAKTHEDALDRIVLMIRELDRRADGALSLDEITGNIPKEARKDKFIVFDAAGNITLSNDLADAVAQAEGYRNEAGQYAANALNALGSANTARNAAIAAQVAAEQALADYQAVFYGPVNDPLNALPTTRPSTGDPSLAGDMLFSTVSALYYAYTGTEWVAIDLISVAQQAAFAAQEADLAEGFKNQAAQSAVEANASKIDAGFSAVDAELARLGSVASAETSQNAAIAAGNSEATAGIHANTASGHADAANAYQELAKGFRDQTVTAKDIAVNASGTAQIYSESAEDFKVQAEGIRVATGIIRDETIVIRDATGVIRDATGVIRDETAVIKSDIETAFGVLSTDPQAMVKLMYNVHSINLPVDMKIEEDERSIILDELVVSAGKKLTVHGKMLIHPYEE